MDKVKQYLAVMGKHHFWILCGIAALAGLGAWYTSTKKLATQFKQDSDKITGQLSQLGQIQSPHPNETWMEGIQQATDAARQDVKAAWEKLYRLQKEKLFIWPANLGQDFIDAASSDLIARDLRVRYQNAIRRYATAHLAEIVDAPQVGEAQPGGMMAPGGINQPELGTGHRVSWPQLADVQSWFDWYEAPSTQLIKYAQEELWVLEALCNVIKAVNAGSTGAHDAPIKVIEEMAIAYTATNDPAATVGRIQQVNTATPATEGAQSPGGGAPGGEAGQRPDPKQRLKGDSGMTRGGGPDGAAAPADPDEVWKSFRYVSDEGKPLAATDPGPAEYNLMPFQLILQMDPREIDRLLVECRNSTLPIEVREVRINASSDRAGGVRPSMARDQYGQPGQQATNPHLARIEVSGVLYLIKPPDATKLGGTAAGGETPAGAPAPGSETTAVPPDSASSLALGNARSGQEALP